MSAVADSSIVINAPMDLVWDMTNDVESWPQLYTEYSKAEILERNGNTVKFRLTMHPDENGKEWDWVSERTSEKSTHTVRARRLETGPFEYMNIFWEYHEVDGGVNMRWVQEFQVKAEMPFNDEAMAKHLKDNTAVQMAHIKDQIEQAAKLAQV
jgi:aromatase